MQKKFMKGLLSRVQFRMKLIMNWLFYAKNQAILTEQSKY